MAQNREPPAFQEYTASVIGRAMLTKGLHKSGRSVYVEMSSSLLKDSADHGLGSVAIARDVTEKQVKAHKTLAA